MEKMPSNNAALGRLDVYRASLELVAMLQGQHHHFSRALRDQAQRAAPSIVLNLAEALGRRGKDRAHLLSIALGSAREVRAIVDVALVTGMLDTASRNAIDACGDRVCAMLHRMRAGA